MLVFHTVKKLYIYHLVCIVHILKNDMQPTVLIIFYESMFDEFTNDYYAIIFFKYTRNNILVGCYLCVKYISNVFNKY